MIEDVAFRRAVDLLDTGDVAILRAYLDQHPELAHQHVLLESGSYFRNPTLVEFVAENPVRHGTLPANIVEVAEAILKAGHEEVLRLLVERGGASLDTKDTLGQGTPADWARHAGRTQIEEYLLARQKDV